VSANIGKVTIEMSDMNFSAASDEQPSFALEELEARLETAALGTGAEMQYICCECIGGCPQEY
jgi:hypothetical protein